MVVVGGVDQLGHLLLQGGHQLGVVVAQGVDGDAAQRVQVFLAVHVPNAAALAALQRDGYAAVSGHNVGRSCLDESGHCKNLLRRKVSGALRHLKNESFDSRVPG
jgi:hypothetical protein